MFDQIIVIDWSANSRPKTGVDSIWLAVHRVDGVETPNVATRLTRNLSTRLTQNVPTRSAAEDLIRALLDAEPLHRTLIGLDFALGYPAGTSESIGLSGRPWDAMWAFLANNIVDGERNENNRFDVAAELNARMTGSAEPFWGCPAAEASEYLATTKPVIGGNSRQWRATEEALSEEGKRPFSCWQLLGAGCVGSQSLLGIPMLHRLARRYSGRFDIWPFTTMLQAPTVKPGSIVAVEVWPSLFQLAAGSDRVRDDLQVDAVATWLRRNNEAGSISALFRPSVNAKLVNDVINEEGWVLGAGVDRNLTEPG